MKIPEHCNGPRSDGIAEWLDGTGYRGSLLRGAVHLAREHPITHFHARCRGGKNTH